MVKVVVTGANGFVGTAVCKELLESGKEVIAVVRDSDSILSDIHESDGIRVVYCDASDFRNLADYIKARDIDIFYHFAWIGSAGPLRNDYEVQLNNVKYTCDSVKACSDMGCKRFVFAASVMEYEVENVMKTEFVPNTNSIYSSSKIAADYMARTIAGGLEIDYIRTIISNVYGPGENSPRLVNTSLRSMIDGKHCAFSPGNQMYDFIYITDAAKALISVGESGKANRSYYIGSSNPQPLKNYLIVMRDCVNPDLEIGLGELPYNGVSLTYDEFDLGAVKKDTGFVPRVGFIEGVNKTIEWLMEDN